MRIKFLIKHNDTIISFCEAIKMGCISIEENGIEEKGKTKVLMFSGLYDNDNDEIYEGDTLRDEAARYYTVLFRSGSFFVTREDPSGKTEDIPLLFLQSHGKVPAKKERRN